MKKCLLSIVLLALMFCSSCDRKQPPKLLNIYDSYESTSDYEVSVDNNNRTISNQDNNNQTISNRPDTNYKTQQDNIPAQIYDIWSYTPQSVYVPAQTTMAQAVYDLYPNMSRCYNYLNLGGIKLIGEMSADKAGYNRSYYSSPITLKILSLSQLNLGWISSNSNIICQIIKGNVVVESLETIYILDNMGVDIIVRNISQNTQNIEFQQGQMVEVSENHVQNVVITTKTNIQLPPQQSKRVRLPVLCAAHHRTDPVGYHARITPYVIKAPSSTFNSQQKVWDYLESYDNPNNYITFYVWGKGTVTISGRRSPLGHAFVKIPHVGVWGFGSLHGGLLGDEGIVSDHASNIRYATDSCRIKVSDEAIIAMKNKLRMIKQNPPNYRIGKYDCTSFVMDIADAGEINYGLREYIQTPIKFMQELKKHNYN